MQANILLEIIDKTGRKINLRKDRWAHILNHPGMANQQERIKETLEKPYKIIKLKDDESTTFYFRYYKDFKQYLLVMVKYLNGKGFIITSFYTDKIK